MKKKDYFTYKTFYKNLMATMKINQGLRNKTLKKTENRKIS